MFKIFMGYDGREEEAYKVAEASIRRRTSDSISISPLSLAHAPERPVETRNGRLWCPISEAPMSTEFAISRFVVPHIVHQGWALFVDCDIICLTDIKRLFALCDDKYAVMVVKHKHETGPNTKMDGQEQLYYHRKNWSSVVLWNCSHSANRRLRMSDINQQTGRWLHAFSWLLDAEIGELPKEWNALVGVDKFIITPMGVAVKRQEFAHIYYPAQIMHFTMGGPWIKDWQTQGMDALWLEERSEQCKTLQLAQS